jgi:hypothetical protein
VASKGPRGYVPARRGATPTQRFQAERAAQKIENVERAAKAKGLSVPQYERGERLVREGRLRALGPQTARELERAERSLSSHRYWELVRDFQKHSAPGANMQQLRSTPEFRQMLLDLWSGDRSKRGRMHDALVALGRRDPRANYAVGDTPA